MDGTKQDTAWPLPTFHFEVDITDVGTKLPFQEVSGLDIETQVIEYRAANAPRFSPVKMPGMVKFGNVTLKKGVFAHDSRFFDWQKNIAMNTIKRSTVTITLLDESGRPTMIWTLQNAWPTKVTGTDLKADGNEVAVESIEFAHEGITIASP